MKSTGFYSFIIFVILFASNCSNDNNASTGNSGSQCTDVSGNHASSIGIAPTVDDWLYQLQNASVTAMQASGFELLVIDYSADGTDANSYTTSDLDALHASGKKVLAYLSIGEAEDYRFYFNDSWTSKNASTGLDQPNANAPCWLGQTNPDWIGNYKVQYWSENWQITILEYLDKIIAAGFDGVYLDIIDGWEYWSDADNEEGFSISKSEAANRMINFVKRIAYHARVTNGQTNFYIFPQNGEPILDYDTENHYLQTISGIGIEDLFYNALTATSVVDSDYRIAFLDTIKGEGKPVIVVDYVDDESGYTGTNKDRIDDFYAKVLAKAYVPYAARVDRSLDEINLISTFQP